MPVKAGQEVCVPGAEAESRREGEYANVLVMDLSTDAVDGVMLVDSMRAGGELRGIRTLAFYSQVEAETRDRARAAGFDAVVPRSRMAREGAAVVDGLLG